MEVGDLIRIVIPQSLQEDMGESLTGYLLHVTEVSKTGVAVVVVSGPHLGTEFFLPYFSREFELISSIRKE